MVPAVTPPPVCSKPSSKLLARRALAFDHHRPPYHREHAREHEELHTIATPSPNRDTTRQHHRPTTPTTPTTPLFPAPRSGSTITKSQTTRTPRSSPQKSALKYPTLGRRRLSGLCAINIRANATAATTKATRQAQELCEMLSGLIIVEPPPTRWTPERSCTMPQCLQGRLDACRRQGIASAVKDELPALPESTSIPP